MNCIETALLGKVIDLPQLKVSPAGKSWAATRVAVGDGEEAQFVRIAMFGELAKRMAPNIEKGAKIYAEGTLRLDRWTDREGKERSGLSLSAWKIEKVGTSAIGRQRAAKPRQLPEGDHHVPPSTRSDSDGAARRDWQRPLDDSIPF